MAIIYLPYSFHNSFHTQIKSIQHLTHYRACHQATIWGLKIVEYDRARARELLKTVSGQPSPSSPAVKNFRYDVFFFRHLPGFILIVHISHKFRFLNSKICFILRIFGFLNIDILQISYIFKPDLDVWKSDFFRGLNSHYRKEGRISPRPIEGGVFRAIFMNIKEIKIQNFKSLYNVRFEPGKVNILIGANGSGKSSVLEAIGVLSAAMTDRVNTNSIQRKGVRLSASSLYKSRFSSIEKESKTVNFGIRWTDEKAAYEYLTYLTVPSDDDSWKYFAESVTCNGEKIYGRSNRSSAQLNNRIGYFTISESLTAKEYVDAGKYIAGYGIYQPDTLTLRGSVPDPMQGNPIGLNGGRLAEAISDLIHVEDDDVMFGTMMMEDVLEMIDWASEFKISKPRKSILNPDVPSTQQVIEFRDKYLSDTSSFTGYDASEGALYVLFMLTLAMHDKAPRMFAIDSFDHALNPRLAKKVTEVFCQKIIEQSKTVFMTTHNPLVLDGLDLSNDDIRLFTTERSENGQVEIRRVQVSEELLRKNQPLSRLWINGLIGGVPELL